MTTHHEPRRSFRVRFWGELFAHSKPLGRRATRWLYVKLLQARRHRTPDTGQRLVSDRIDMERLAQAVSRVEWAYMRNEGRYPAPSREGYERGLRVQLAAMSQKELRAGPLSNRKIAAEYEASDSPEKP